MKTEMLLGRTCPLPTAGTAGKVLTRIFIEENGDLVVTDLWEEIRAVLEGPTVQAAPEGEGR